MPGAHRHSPVGRSAPRLHCRLARARKTAPITFLLSYCVSSANIASDQSKGFRHHAAPAGDRVHRELTQHLQAQSIPGTSAWPIASPRTQTLVFRVFRTSHLTQRGVGQMQCATDATRRWHEHMPARSYRHFDKDARVTPFLVMSGQAFLHARRPSAPPRFSS